MIEIQVRATGPIYDGRADTALSAYVDDLHRTVAQEGQDLVGLQLIKVLKHPTGYYESRIRHDRVSATTSRVSDSNVIYGPWLEGVGSRNYPVTRFKGYATFRKVVGQLRRRARPVALTLLARKYIGRMGG